jgi:WD40 repeat protein
MLYSGGHEQVRSWDIATGACRAVWPGHSGRIVSIAVSSDGERIASGSDDRSVRLWCSDGQCQALLDGAERAVVAVDFSSAGGLLAGGSEDGSVRLWDSSSGEIRQVLRMPRPYEGMNISGVRGLSAAQRRTLRALGAIERTE